MCSFGIGYPDKKSERDILKGDVKHSSIKSKTLLTPTQIDEYMERASCVKISDALFDFLQDIIAYTRDSGRFEYGLSTRGALSLTAMVKSWAMLQGRDYVIPDDLKMITPLVCSHRLVFKEGATTAEKIYVEIFKNIYPDT